MIKNIIFDVGDVLLEYRWRDMLMDYGLSADEAGNVGQMMFDDPLWTELDLSDSVGYKEITNHYMKKYPKYAEAIQWFLTHTEYMYVPREEIWELVHKLKGKGYRLYLLSNYPEVMFQKHTEGAAFMKDIDGGVISYQVRKVKPDPAIYHALLGKYGLTPEECLFFDDRPQNTEAAAKLGIKTVTVISRQFLAEKLQEILNGKLNYI